MLDDIHVAKVKARKAQETSYLSHTDTDDHDLVLKNRFVKSKALTPPLFNYLEGKTIRQLFYNL